MLKTRIDAELHQVPSPEHPLVSGTRGVLLLHHDPGTAAALDDVRRRADTAFNDHLNTVAAGYGLRVVNVLPSMRERAIAYDAAFGGTPALEEAKGLRALLLPAARLTWSPDGDLLQRMLRLADTVGIDTAVAV